CRPVEGPTLCVFGFHFHSFASGSSDGRFDVSKQEGRQRGTPSVAPMRKLILTNYQAPGDILMLTAALRDLHHCFPNQFLTDVRSSCPELWQNNPYLVPLATTDPDVASLHCEYPLIHQSDLRAVHFLHGFIDFLNAQLNLQIRPSQFKGDIHLSESE